MQPKGVQVRRGGGTGTWRCCCFAISFADVMFVKGVQLKNQDIKFILWLRFFLRQTTPWPDIKQLREEEGLIRCRRGCIEGGVS